MPAGRTLVRMVMLAAAIGAGVYLGFLLVAQRAGRADDAASGDAGLDLSLADASRAELVAHGFRLTGREPASWSAISMRLHQDRCGSVAVMRCLVDPGDAGALVDIPAGSHRPLHDEPPAGWPWGGGDDPFRVPSWWQPRGTQSRCWESRDHDGWASGCFVAYDPATHLLHAWRWRRNDLPASSVQRGGTPVVDDLVEALFAARDNVPVAARDGAWRQVLDVPAAACGLAAGRLPDAVERIDAAAWRDPGGRRWLLALHGLDAPAAWELIGETPMRSLPDDGPAPTAPWRFALPSASAAAAGPGLPAWFVPGPGPRRAHCLLVIGSGAVEAGRWAAYDRERRTLYVWSWSGPDQPAAADLCAEAR